ncbi:ABC transporter substrate-binding protein [Adhaeretor mobilis]|uniref:Bacterial extracellular solute-binding protein n=1 Tax=Adhaeretor mobilis TaxID=1930276 RepID=A0A517MXB5_9BACT|nr:ABC transporter substrate-binding protein [Adhaeretor mobilis]QDS99503.1 Bacterial extracellular solute-binding protein [Adhaeretor mobilis]
MPHAAVPTHHAHRQLLAALSVALCAIAGLTASTAGAADEVVERLIDRPAFDLITLSSGNTKLETVLLDFPNRTVPNPLPKSGTLKLYQLSQPSKEYILDWKSIAKVELYEQLVLTKAIRLTSQKEFVEAFEHFAFLHKNYADLPGLEQASQNYLIQDAAAAYERGASDEALTILAALYERNPQHKGLQRAAPLVSNKLIEDHLSSDNYSAARTALASVRKTFPKLQLKNLDGWQQKFEQAARTKLAVGEAAFQAKDFAKARAAVQAAYDILPGMKESADLLEKIQQAAPEVRVGVSNWGATTEFGRGLTFAEQRVDSLVRPELVQMIGFGAEGGDYSCPWGELKTNDAGLVTTLKLSPKARDYSVTADALARTVLAMSNPERASYSAVVAELLEGVSLIDGSIIRIAWKRPHIRPQALLQTSTGHLGQQAEESPWFRMSPLDSSKESSSVRYERDSPVDDGPQNIVEMLYPSDEAALNALVRGEVDALDRVPVWQLDRLERTTGVRVGTYRMPTVHVLAINFDNPLLATREFRRALCYAIDRETIVSEILLGGRRQAGFLTLSGPFPAGSSLNDPVSYAYKKELQPRPYEPRLASVLSAVARANLAKLAEAKRKAESASAEKKQDTEKEASESEEGDEKPKPPPKPLILAYQNDPIAQLACQTLKLQLDGVGIPIQLKELPPLYSRSELESIGYDLLYTELAMQEPVVDARRLLGPEGLAGHSTAYMNLALDKLDQASNWSEASAQLKEIHEIAHYDLPVIPLWQTVNNFAYRDVLEGVGTKPVELYQNVNNWQKRIGGASL